MHVMDGGERTCLLLPVSDHIHGPGCGHEAVPHLDHIDWLVGATERRHFFGGTIL